MEHLGMYLAEYVTSQLALTFQKLMSWCCHGRIKFVSVAKLFGPGLAIVNGTHPEIFECSWMSLTCHIFQETNKLSMLYMFTIYVILFIHCFQVYSFLFSSRSSQVPTILITFRFAESLKTTKCKWVVEEAPLLAIGKMERRRRGC